MLGKHGGKIDGLLIRIRKRHGLARLERFWRRDWCAQKLLLPPLWHVLVNETGKGIGRLSLASSIGRTHILPYSQVTAVDVDPLSLERRAGVGQQPVALVHAEERLRGSEQRDRRPERCGWAEERPSRFECRVKHVR